ncbi:DUF1178 family protein [Sphingomonas xinjiangensis]|uniref:DUF1178 family protein n=1 Tax=Sphingomonas xinjiangensis TaxID=643568 RepID=A0A840YAS8_9SPHN|nr:DUF1178 family protein [Sphingomonas xinjiangensis]MBB5710437.1 hypothetical protein [Sphingomonas xinjiangensis]
MIVFDLKCTASHVFEAWFGSSTTYEEQRDAGLILCPICGDKDVTKAVMAPNLAAKSNQRAERMPAPGVSAPNQTRSPAAVKAAIAKLAAAQATLLEKSQWVGSAFTDKARAMHVGDAPAASIHGQATAEQAKELIEEGIPVAPLPLPVVPPEACN